MQDSERLIRLLKLIENDIHDWYQPIAARQLAEFDQVSEGPNASAAAAAALDNKTPAEAAADRLSQMTRYIELADLWFRSEGRQGSHQDAYQLPGFALEAVTGVPEDMISRLGTWVHSALGLSRADPDELGHLWLQDVRDTAWRLLIAEGAWPGQHTERRPSL